MSSALCPLHYGQMSLLLPSTPWSGAYPSSDGPGWLRTLSKGCQEVGLLWAEYQESICPPSHTRFDPSASLDFLWACIHVPRIWQGRDQRTPQAGGGQVGVRDKSPAGPGD